MKICICSSFKYYKEVLDLKKTLCEKNSDVEVLIPIPNKYFELAEPYKTDYTNKLEDKVLKEYWEHVLNHLKRIDQADIVYILSKDGYVGTGVGLEIGYCHAKNKILYSSEEIRDIAISCFINKVVPTEKISNLLKQK